MSWVSGALASVSVESGSAEARSWVGALALASSLRVGLWVGASWDVECASGDVVSQTAWVNWKS